MVEVNCGVHVEGLEPLPEDNTSELTGIVRLEEFRKLVETAIVSASLDVEIAIVHINYDLDNFYPDFVALQEFKLVVVREAEFCFTLGKVYWLKRARLSQL